MRIAEQKCNGSLRARVDGRLIRNTFFIGSKVIRYRVNGVLVIRSFYKCLIRSKFDLRTLVPRSRILFCLIIGPGLLAFILRQLLSLYIFQQDVMFVVSGDPLRVLSLQYLGKNWILQIKQQTTQLC